MEAFGLTRQDLEPVTYGLEDRWDSNPTELRADLNDCNIIVFDDSAKENKDCDCVNYD